MASRAWPNQCHSNDIYTISPSDIESARRHVHSFRAAQSIESIRTVNHIHIIMIWEHILTYEYWLLVFEINNKLIRMACPLAVAVQWKAMSIQAAVLKIIAFVIPQESSGLSQSVRQIEEHLYSDVIDSLQTASGMGRNGPLLRLIVAARESNSLPHLNHSLDAYAIRCVV